MSELISVEKSCICRSHTSDSLLINVNDSCPIHGKTACKTRLYDSEDGTYAGKCKLRSHHKGEHILAEVELVDPPK